ncbi:MAG: hypothetical protein JWN34_1348 [Bryobacterales bacterium]|nr:hypothetical protein [Bryobacterales bacterium]
MTGARTALVEAAQHSLEGRACLAELQCRLALASFEQALRLGEPPTEHLHERWICHMLLGDFEGAWQESDLAEAWFPRPVPERFGRLVIRCLRGLGDAIQFLRFVPALRRRCDRIEVEAPRGLLPLLACMRGIDEIVPMGLARPLLPGDCQVECSDLPYLLRASIGTLPPPASFDIPRRITRPPLDRLRIALVWASGDWNNSRSIPPSELEPLSRIPDIDLYSLQRSPHGPKLPPIELPWVRNLEPLEPNILATADAILQMDLVISVDTMVAHLAACLGKPVWLLLTPGADWRWLLDRRDSPWYSTMRIFRQKRDQEFATVRRQLVSALTVRPSGLPDPEQSVNAATVSRPKSFVG